MDKNIGRTIKYYRVGLGLSQEYMASALGVTQPLYAAYENGKKSPKFETVKEIANALGIHPLLLYRDDFNNNRGYFYKLILDNCKNISQNEDGTIQVTFDQSFESLYDFYIHQKQRDEYIAEDFEFNSPEYAQKMNQQEVMKDFFFSTWPEFDYSYKISIGEEIQPKSIAQRHAHERFTEKFTTFFSKVKKFLEL